MKVCMVVDDSSVIRKVASRILASPAMVVTEAEDGASALAMCRRGLPDIIVVDGVLPDMATEDFIREVVAMDPTFKPRIMICMAELDVASYMRAKRAGAAGYILKPFDRARLLERFRELDAAA